MKSILWRGLLCLTFFSFVTSALANDTPVNTVPGDQNVDEDNPLLLSPANGNGFSVSDDGSALEVTLSVNDGTLSLGSTAGLTITDGANGSNSITIDGSISNINSALNSGLTYQPNLDYNGSDKIQISTTDKDPFTPLNDTDQVNITVHEVNDAPENSVPTIGLNYDEGGSTSFSVEGGNPWRVKDPDALYDALTITISTTAGKITLGDSRYLNFLDGGDGSDYMKFSASGPDANVALNGTTFDTPKDFNGSAIVTITTNDNGNHGKGGQLEDIDSFTITIDAVNDTPGLLVPGGQIIDEDGTLVFHVTLGNQISGTDPDYDYSTGSPYQMTVQSSEGGIFTLPSTMGLDVYATGDGTDELTVTGNLADVNKSLDGLTFVPQTNFDGTETVIVIINDLGSTGSGDPMEHTETISITVNPVNDAPIGTVPDRIDTVEETEARITDGFSVTDVDASNNTLTVTLTVGNGTLDVSDNPGVTITGNNSPSVQLDGSQDDINGSVNDITYTPVTNFYGTDTFTYTISDNGYTGGGGEQTTSGTVEINVQGVNDAPVISGPGDVSTDEDIIRDFVPSGIGGFIYADVDGEDGVATVSISVCNGSVGVPESQDYTVTDNNSGILTINGTISQINSALGGLQYTPSSNFTGNCRMTVTGNDNGNTGTGGPLTAEQTINITVTPINDAPVIVVPSQQTFFTDFDNRFSDTNDNQISVSDVDDNGGQFTIDLTVSQGALTISDETGLTYNAGSNNSSAMAFTGTINDINNALNGMRYTPNTGYTGSDQLNINFSDNGIFGAGGPFTVNSQVDITVRGPNQPPDLDPFLPVTMDESATTTLTISATDPENDPLAFDMSNNPDFMNLADNGDGTATITIQPGYEDAGVYTDIQVTVTDQVLNPKTDTETFTVTVNDVNQAPMIDPIPYQKLFEGQDVQLPIQATDPNGNNLSLGLSNNPPFVQLTDNGDGTGFLDFKPGYSDAGVYPQITITATDNGTPSLQSTALFELVIEDYQLSLLSPNGNERFGFEDGVSVQWTSTDTDGNALSKVNGSSLMTSLVLDSVVIEYSIDNGATWIVISSGTENDGVYDWIVPNTPSDQCLVRISGPTGEPSDISDDVFTILAPSSVENPTHSGTPDRYYLSQNVPNPFNPSTTISYGLPKASTVSLVVYNLRGELIATLEESVPKSAGFHHISWDGRNRNGNPVPSGIYLYHLRTEKFSRIRKMTLTK